MAYRFVRSLPWLRFVFPPSETPRDLPGQLGNDVQLSHDYFGGSCGPPEPVNWFSSVPVTKAADNTIVDISEMPTGQNTRVYSVGIRNLAMGGNVLGLVCTLLVGDGFGLYVPISIPGTLAGPGTSSVFRGRFTLPAGGALVIGGAPTVLAIYFQTGDNSDYQIEAYFNAVNRGISIFA